VKLLFIGDIVGRPGRRAVKELLPKLREQHALDFIIANGENSAGGSGITPATAGEIFSAGVDVITSGDHLWDQKEVMELLAGEKRFLRPLNYPPGAPGRGSGVFETQNSKLKIAVLNAQGRTFMQPQLENPFLLAAEEVKRLREQTRIIFVDFHAEATSEKIAFGRFLDGQVSAVIGTHTHVQTADERILPGGTAYITDIGMTGPTESVIGMKTETAIARSLTQMPLKMEVQNSRAEIQGILFEIDTTSGKVTRMERVRQLSSV